MQSIEFDVLQQIRRWLSQGKQPWLCTIVATVGSSPRPPGSMLAHCQGETVGTLSGGCVEEDLIEKLDAGELSGETPLSMEYGVTAEENERLGLPCGGRLQVLVQQLGPSDTEWIEAVNVGISERSMIVRRTDLASGATSTAPTSTFLPLRLCDTELFQCLGPRMRMLLVGAGQLAQVLAQLGLAMDFDVSVLDSRESVLTQWSGPEVPLLHGLPDDLLIAQQPDSQTIIITLTHDPRIDDMALLEALETDAWYVGALGSVRTTAARRERLLQLGLAESRLKRLHAPVGLPIGSKTPWEIAIAIMAEITQLHRQAIRDAALASASP